MNNLIRTLFSTVLVVITAIAVFAGGFVAGHVTATQGIPIPGLAGLGGSPANSGTPANLSATFAPFWEAWGIVHQEYVDQPVKDQVLMQGAIRGMMDALGDKHTLYESPAEAKIVDTTLSGQLEGIGAFVDKGNSGLLIVSTFAGSPAAAAGLQPNDLIVKVDGKDITTMDEIQAISLVRGPAGSKVHLTIARQGSDKPLEFDVVRAKINVPSVESKMLPSQVAYIKINDFGQNTSAELTTALQKLLGQQPRGLVLDLRNNPGGYLDSAVDVATQFMPSGSLVISEKYGDGHLVPYNAKSGGLALKVPMVVLIDGGSASAAEIVSGALQDTQRAKLVGVTSYGKGTVQLIHQLSHDGGVVRVTVARWLTPNGRSIDQLGLTPDFSVPLTKPDQAAGRDPQLDKAVSILTGQSSSALHAISAQAFRP